MTKKRKKKEIFLEGVGFHAKDKREGNFVGALD